MVLVHVCPLTVRPANARKQARFLSAFYQSFYPQGEWELGRLRTVLRFACLGEWNQNSNAQDWVQSPPYLLHVVIWVSGGCLPLLHRNCLQDMNSLNSCAV